MVALRMAVTHHTADKTEAAHRMVATLPTVAAHLTAEIRHMVAKMEAVHPTEEVAIRMVEIPPTEEARLMAEARTEEAAILTEVIILEDLDLAGMVEVHSIVS